MDTSSKATPRPGAATGDPNLASVPAKPQPILTPEQRKALMQDLVRDRENARYTDQAVRIGDVPEAAPPRPAPPRPVARPGAAATSASAGTPAAASAQRPAAAKDDDSPWWWPFGGGKSDSEASEPAPVRETPVPAPPPTAPAAAAPPTAPPTAESDDSPWWWPFGGSRPKETARAPTAQELAAGANSIAATPENMRAPAGIMPVTGKPLPQPDSNEPAPAPLVMAPVPATPPPAAPGATRIGAGSAPQAATVPAMPPVDAPPPRAALRPEAAGRAPPPPAVAELPPTPPRAAPAGAAAVRVLAAAIEFPAGAATMPADAGAALEEVARMHKEHGGKVRVVAQTLRSAAGTAGDALLASSALATDRTGAITRELVRLGVADGAIVAATAPGAAGREPRRVDVYVEY
ncbi:MAG: hypothetical protein IT561_22325 [Alphaproteobacteria bacterium]|nr:hypothetical protein [Alphaproteobacteria bacterium]